MVPVMAVATTTSCHVYLSHAERWICSGRLIPPGFRRANLATNIRSQAVRRHRRRRYSDSRGTNGKSLFWKDEMQDIASPDVEDKVVVTIDLQDVQSRATAVAVSAAEATKNAMQTTTQAVVRLGKAVANDGTEFWRDLRSSIAFQNDTRVIISVRRSSIEFAANVIVYSFLLLVFWRIFARAANKYRWGWGESYGSQRVVRRDRSLGGKEVLVARRGIDTTSVSKFVTEAAKTSSPLDGVGSTRSEKELVKQRETQKKRGKRWTRLPGWWPDLKASTPVVGPDENPVQAKEISTLVHSIMEKRLSGHDFEEDDIIQLRRVCKGSGAKVRFDTLNVRDSFYRAAIDFILSSCGRHEAVSTFAEYAGEKAIQFIAGLAENIDIEADRAATMVNAAVAARTRSSFLQALALHIQGRDAEAEEELLKLGRIHFIFPPEKNSPEMEMVAQGLAKHLTLEERRYLFQMYLKAHGSATHTVASEALGLASSGERG